jgi:hypothetical protein
MPIAWAGLETSRPYVAAVGHWWRLVYGVSRGADHSGRKL